MNQTSKQYRRESYPIRHASRCAEAIRRRLRGHRAGLAGGAKQNERGGEQGPALRDRQLCLHWEMRGGPVYPLPVQLLVHDQRQPGSPSANQTHKSCSTLVDIKAHC